MENNQLNTPTSLHKRQGKDKYFQAQMKRVFSALYRQPKTMLMVEVETGIMRSNICRYVAKWRKKNCIKIVKLGICQISKSTGVQFLTTNPDFFPANAKPSNTDML
jgi:hypothetical protein